MRAMTIILIVAFICYLLSSFLDYVISDKGVAAGRAQEGNSVVTYLFGSHPSLEDYILYAIGEAVAFSLPLLLMFIAVPIGFLGTLAGLGVMTVKHFIAYRQWLKDGAKL